MIRSFSIFLVFFSLAPRVSAFEVTALGGLNYAAPTETRSGVNQQFTGDAAGAAGISLGFNLFGSAFDFETGAIRIAELSEQNLNGVISSRSTQTTQIPLLFRFHFDQSISLGLGGYLSFLDNEVDTTTSGITSKTDLASVGLKKGDRGALVSLQARLHLVTQLYLVLDARYQHGFTNLSTQTSDVHNTRSIEMLGGLSLGF